MRGIHAVIALDRNAGSLVHPTRVAIERILALLGIPDRSLEIYLVEDAVSGVTALSYPSPRGFPRPDCPGRFLGELYLNPGRIAREGKSFRSLLIHGLLHLAGYAHEQKQDIMEMRRKEKRLERVCSTILSD